MDVGDFLRELGLQQYEAAFRDNRIDIRVLPKLTAEDLKDLGVTLIGDRRMLLDAIAALREPTAPGVKTGGDALDAGLIRGTEAATTAQAERRPLSVMFCDLIGSTALSSRLDPEDLREVIRMYQACVATTIGQFDGFIARYVGDGVLIYFGWPEARETDAERAVRAGLAVAAAVSETPVGGEPLQVRIGIATGLVVIGDPIGSGDSRQQTAVGETPNIAARLQGLAGPGQVVIDAATRRQMGGLFEYRDLGNVALKGFAEDVPVWQVLGVGTAESRFEALHGTTTPLVGRDEELALLQRRWQQAKGGEGCVVLVSGEPGIGKSRLAQTLFERLAGEPHTRLRLFCSPHHQDSALYPTITQLERAAGFRREDTAAQRLDKLEAVLAQATNELSEAAPLIAALLSLPARERYSPLDLIPQKQKEKTLRALVAQVEGLAVRQPVLMLFEDAHWSDPTSLELLDLIIDRVPGLPLLLIITFRPEFSPPWAGRPHVNWLGLNRLPPRQRAEMIAGVTGGKALPQEIAAQIIDRTDGVPLFVEELTKAVVESGMLTDAGDRYTAAGPATLLAVPASLQASLLARLDRLAPVREVAQIGAALGRQFSHELIGAVAPMPPAQLDDALAQLVRAELIYRRGTPPDAEYTFKHALVQDAAYSTLLRSRRQQLHARIAAILEARFPEIVTSQPERLAHHFDAASLTDPAIDYYRRAANRAIAASANLEATVHLKRGLGLFASLPASAERSSRELDFRLALGPPLMATQGWGSVEAEANYARAKVLGSEVGEFVELFRSLVGLWVHQLCRPDRPDARRPLEASQELLLLAARLGGNDVSLLAEYTACVSCHWAGRFAETLSHAAQVFAIYDPRAPPRAEGIRGGPGHDRDELRVDVIVVPRLSRSRASARARRPLDGSRGGPSVQPVLGIVARGLLAHSAERARIDCHASRSAFGARKGAGLPARLRGCLDVRDLARGSGHGLV